MAKRFQLVLNNADNLQLGLNEYLLDIEHFINQIQMELNKISGDESSLKDMDISDKSTYIDSVHKMFADKTNAMKLKLDLYKIATEVLKANGNEKKALESAAKEVSLDIKAIQKLCNTPDVEQSKTYNIKG